MEKKTVKYLVLNGGKPLMRGSLYSAGWDIATPEKYELKPYQATKIKTKLYLSLPAATFGKIESRSGLALKVSTVTLRSSAFEGTI